MPTSIAHYREAGDGAGIVCIHGSASSSGQWRPLMNRLSSRFHVIAPDLYGHGHTPAWPEGRRMCVDDEVDLLQPAFGLAGDRFHLIGHSWGGAIALKAALRLRPRLESLTLFEPALWSLLIAEDPSGPAALEITAVSQETERFMDHADFAAAAECFVDYWIGPGTWKLTPHTRRSAFVDGMHSARSEWHASFGEPTPLAAFAAVDVPTLLLTGSQSPVPARAITELIRSVLPRVRVVELEAVGHMGPVTHPELVNDAIESFLLGLASTFIAAPFFL